MKFLGFSRVQATALILTATVTAGSASAATFRTRSLAPIGWSSTATRGLAGKLVSVTDFGAVNPSMPMHVEIGLTTNMTAIKQGIAAIYTPGSRYYHQFLTPAQFTAMFSPSQAQANAVASYLVQSGLTNVSIESNRLTISAYGNAGTIEAAFNTSLHNYTQAGRAIFANTTPAQVPTSLAGAVTSVLGLNSIGMHTFNRRSPQANVARAKRRLFSGHVRRDLSPCETPGPICALNEYYPSDLAIAYDGSGQLTGAGEHLGIFTEGDLTQTKSDLAQALAADNQAPVKIHEKDVLGAATDTSGTDEWDIDSQSSTGMSGGVKSLTFYNGTSLESDSITATFSRFASDNLVKLANASFGGCETLSFVEGEMSTDDTILAEAAMQGQSVFVSAGDGGSQCSVEVNPGAPVGIPDVEYPASSPYVTAVGGTSLLTNSPAGTYYGELTWVNGGGGISLYETAAPWQVSNISLAAAGQRLVPDVTNDADPNVSGMNTVVSGAYAGYGGTSLASPMTMGVYARLEALTSNKLGVAAEALYVDYNNVTNDSKGVLPSGGSTAVSPAYGGFHDIIAGSNTIYQATPGYDLTSGIGSLDIAAILKDFGG